MGKPDRIKRVQFVQNYENGGVKMPDVEMHINAFKQIGFGGLFWVIKNG
jgi:hypothetical protein